MGTQSTWETRRRILLMKFPVLLAALAAANAWDPKKTFLPKNEIEALSCKNGKASPAGGEEVTIESPNYPDNYPNKAKCNWKIKVPANEEVHIWCETLDIALGDFLWVKGMTPKLTMYGYHDNGVGEIIPATSEARTLKIQFRSNKKKNAGGFRCQIAAFAQITGSGSGPTTGSGSRASCLTNDGPAAGSACAFPFNYMGVSHTGCTMIDGDPTPCARLRLTRTTTTSLESAPGDTVMPLALFKDLAQPPDLALAQPLDLAPGQPPDLAQGPPAQPTTDPLAPSRSTTWASSTLVAPRSTGTPRPGARL